MSVDLTASNCELMKKLWEKDTVVDSTIERFTIGKDPEMDLFLARYDVLGSMAHITMLEQIDLLTKDELDRLLIELKAIYVTIEAGSFFIEPGVEDVHSQVELMLTRRLGDIGKKIHSGRSRNDQVLLDMKLYTRSAIKEIHDAVVALIDGLIEQSERYKEVLMPGYTHLQVAMPSSFGLWFGAYAESLVDDLLLLQAAYRLCNRNPLGSAAGYGSSFPLKRQLTTDLLGFDGLNYNVVYAQMGRGKMERNVAFALSSIASTLSRLAFDACLYTSQNFGFIKLPDAFTTGSSIMPHKKNPDVFELIRGKCNKLQTLPYQLNSVINNLPSGYFRDFQLLKELFIPAFGELVDCLSMTHAIMTTVEVNSHILDDEKYQYLYSVEVVNKLVLEGVPFRDAYKQVGLAIEHGSFLPDKHLHHTHEGSLGNLCNQAILERKASLSASFAFEVVEAAEARLLGR
ncbi:MAG TPA: argininosuccinate lyase [Bacteroidales bacterium]|nr:argininosuccinate lyase [Bacteroidales bacterium]